MTESASNSNDGIAAARELLDNPEPESVEPGTPPRLPGFITNDQGTPKPLLANALLFLRNDDGLHGLAFDELRHSVVLREPAPWCLAGESYPRLWRPADDVGLAERLQYYGVLVGVDIAARAAERVASERPFHPVQDYLDSLSWDGGERISGNIEDYFHAAPADRDREQYEARLAYVRAVLRTFFVSAVARVRQPGIKVDHVPILEGPQGIGKSTAIDNLFAPWTTDELPDLHSKDASLQVQGVWCIELSELDGLSRSEVNAVKSFLSRRTDRFRPPYGTRPVEAPRQCVFIGTVNDDSYLLDATGNRRFLPIRCGSIDVEGLARDRDQLFAEAAELFAAGERWWITEQDVLAQATAEQQDRFQQDAWQDAIQRYIEGRNYVTVQEILSEVLHIQRGRWDQSAQNRIARTLKSMGWTRVKMTVDGRRRWVYQRGNHG